MTLDGKGALTRDEAEHIALGYTTVLPQDREGRSVIYFDRRKKSYDDATADEWKVRGPFYCLHVSSENVLSQSRGVFDTRFVEVAVDTSKD